MASAYIIASVTVTNPEQYEEYRKLSSIAMQTISDSSERRRRLFMCFSLLFLPTKTGAVSFS